jgi:hypothetical protein
MAEPRRSAARTGGSAGRRVVRSPKTRPTNADVRAFVDAIPNEARRADARVSCNLLAEVTGEPARLWGPSIVGFGTYHYRYATGHEGDAPLASFSPRSAHLVVYLTGGFGDRHARLLERLGPHRTGKACLYLKRLADVDLDVLRELVRRSLEVHRGQDRASSSGRRMVDRPGD